MEISIIEELKNFEISEKAELEKKKKEFLKSLEEIKKESIERHNKALSRLSLEKPSIILKSKEKAKQDSLKSIVEYNKKTEEITEKANERVEEATELILKEFLNQNV